MNDSGFTRYIDEYKSNCLRNVKLARAEIYHRFHKLIDGNTPTQSKLDIQRIFHKIIYYNTIFAHMFIKF